MLRSQIILSRIACFILRVNDLWREAEIDHAFSFEFEICLKIFSGKHEREPIANLEDGMECEDGAITFSECPDISWIGAEASDVIYTFSELG